MTHFDAIIIGSGQGGTPLAKRLANEGWKTALIEKSHVGGTCVNVGCTPTKTMIASAKVAYTVAKAENYGVRTSGNEIDIHTILERKNKVVNSFRGGSLKGLQETENLQLIFGKASFSGDKKMRVELNEGGEIEISADTIFIDTGTRPSIPAIEGLDEVGYFTSTTLMEYPEVPTHLLIIGGGYIGLEFGQMYRRFGSKVTILEHGSRFLPREDEDIAEEVLKFLHEEEIEIFTNAQVNSVKGKPGNITATAMVNGKEKTLFCSHILIAAGRTPNTESLNLDAIGIETNDRGYLVVNDQLQTSAEGVYAIGDVKGGPEFTHIAYHDYLILFHNLVNGKSESINDRLVPYTMFTDPQLGRVGITEQEARGKGLQIKVAKLSMAHVARAIETGDTRGIMKAVVDAETDKILGVAILGQEGGEVMTVLQMAMVGGLIASQISEMVIAHPLYAESLNNLFMKMG